MNIKTIKAALKQSIPIMMGYIFLGFAFGVLLSSKGYSLLYALLMSVFIYAGSMQFVAIGLLVTGASFFSTLCITLMINARHLFYGLSMLNKFDNMGALKPYMIFSLTDETFSLLVKIKYEDTYDKKYFMFFISLFNQLYWVLGSILGCLFGGTVSFNTTGLDFSMTALFVVIVVEQYRQNKQHLATYLGFFISCICLFLFGSDNFIIPSMIGILCMLGICQKYLEDNYE